MYTWLSCAKGKKVMPYTYTYLYKEIYERNEQRGCCSREYVGGGVTVIDKRGESKKKVVKKGGAVESR